MSQLPEYIVANSRATLRELSMDSVLTVALLPPLPPASYCVSGPHLNGMRTRPC